MPDTHQTALSVALGLILIGVIATAGIVVVACLDKPIPPSLAGICGAAVGALGGHMGAMGWRRSNGNARP